MIISLSPGLVGSAGAAGAAMAQHGSMAGMGSGGASAGAASGGGSLLALLNHIALPLLIVSIVLMLLGVLRAGWRPLGLVGMGSALLLATIFPVAPLGAAALLGAGYALVFAGFWTAWRQAKHGHGAQARP